MRGLEAPEVREAPEGRGGRCLDVTFRTERVLGDPNGPQEDRRQATHTWTGRCTELATGRASTDRRRERPEARGRPPCWFPSLPALSEARGTGHPWERSRGLGAPGRWECGKGALGAHTEETGDSLAGLCKWPRHTRAPDEQGLGKSPSVTLRPPEAQPHHSLLLPL